jgi:hypothetical protein
LRCSKQHLKGCPGLGRLLASWRLIIEGKGGDKNDDFGLEETISLSAISYQVGSKVLSWEMLDGEILLMGADVYPDPNLVRTLMAD